MTAAPERYNTLVLEAYPMSDNLQTLTMLGLLCYTINQYELLLKNEKPSGYDEWEVAKRQHDEKVKAGAAPQDEGPRKPEWERHRPTLIFW